jgi:methionyl-tRNA synthetase
VAGVAEFFKPEELVGKQVIVVANLKPVKLRGVESQGMLLAVRDDKGLAFIAPERDTPSGIKVT